MLLCKTYFYGHPRYDLTEPYFESNYFSDKNKCTFSYLRLTSLRIIFKNSSISSSLTHTNYSNCTTVEVWYRPLYISFSGSSPPTYWVVCSITGIRFFPFPLCLADRKQHLVRALLITDPILPSLSLSLHLCFILLCFLLWVSLSPSSSPSAPQALRPLTFVSIPSFLPLLTVNTCTLFEWKNTMNSAAERVVTALKRSLSHAQTQAGGLGGVPCVCVCVCVSGPRLVSLTLIYILIQSLFLLSVIQMLKHVSTFVIHHKFLKLKKVLLF